MPVKIVITMEGGCLKAVCCTDHAAEVEVMDFDEVNGDQEHALEVYIDAKTAGMMELDITSPDYDDLEHDGLRESEDGDEEDEGEPD